MPAALASAPVGDAGTVLSVGLTVRVERRDGALTLVEDVGFSIAAGRTLCLVGESGCGKSLALAVMGLLATPPLRVSAGRIAFEGRNILEMDPVARRSARRPDRDDLPGADDRRSTRCCTVGDQIAEVLRLHIADWARSDARDAGRRRCCGTVGIPDAGATARRVPAPVLRRHAPARDDRDGAGLRARRC